MKTIKSWNRGLSKIVKSFKIVGTPTLRSRAPDHLRSSRRGPTYSGVPEEPWCKLPELEKPEDFDIATNFRKWIFCQRKKIVKTKIPDGPGDQGGHWRMCFGHGEDDGKGPRAWNSWKLWVLKSVNCFLTFFRPKMTQKLWKWTSTDLQTSSIFFPRGRFPPSSPNFTAQINLNNASSCGMALPNPFLLRCKISGP